MRLKELPVSIVLDRYPKVTSEFWLSMHTNLGMRLASAHLLDNLIFIVDKIFIPFHKPNPYNWCEDNACWSFWTEVLKLKYVSSRRLFSNWCSRAVNWIPSVVTDLFSHQLVKLIIYIVFIRAVRHWKRHQFNVQTR